VNCKRKNNRKTKKKSIISPGKTKRKEKLVENQMYGAREIEMITGFKTTSAYELIKKLQKMFKEENPDALIFKNKIPKTYFEEKVLGKKERSEKP
jgi:hypothetical protein